jgi:HSP20 family protein
MTLTQWNRPELLERHGNPRWISLHDELDRLLGVPFFSMPRPSSLLDGWAPALDLIEDKDEFTVTVELPGMRKEEIEVSLHDGLLTIYGDRRENPPTGAKAHRTERFVGRFQRSVSLPCAVESGKIKASYTDGILVVKLPKQEAAKPKHIEIQVK